ncbi:methyltransferase domain-containing protein [Hyphococcus flavus]|uniref:Methyltransferase domain-containing protein n=1 Tax=Hyphococcus flavus TaxID=1866326 RepID=A0AAF0CH33_9PROT|nr:methyltransferase domain-containing protein [Hyphococcus flavus]WDI33149.1 methyltransferase domain-containing protein [Hyphococcus flavus]
MRTDILDFHEFYRSQIGVIARESISAQLAELWGDGAGLAIVGFGHADPYLEMFSAATRCLSFAPGAQGVIQWPNRHANAACLVGEKNWPLPDASIDRLLIVHGLEEAPTPHRLLREAWRVLKDDGRMIIVASHRRGLWSVIDTTPFAAGRPYFKRRLERLLQDSMFRPRFWDTALFFPPLGSGMLLKAARTWERAGARLWPGLGGVLMLEAEKDMLAPVGLARAAGARTMRPALAAPRPARRSSV